MVQGANPVGATDAASGRGGLELVAHADLAELVVVFDLPHELEAEVPVYNEDMTHAGPGGSVPAFGVSGRLGSSVGSI